MAQDRAALSASLAGQSISDVGGSESKNGDTREEERCRRSLYVQPQGGGEGLFANCRDLYGPAFPIKNSREEEKSP